MTPPTAPERCTTCDRDGLNCPTLETLVRGTLPQTEVRRIAIAAMQDCHAHRVDWRARAIAAEIRAEEAEAHGAGSDALIDAICQRVGARDTGCGGQTVEAGEMRRRMNMTQRIDMLTSAAAQWAKVAPLIERLRHTRRHTKPEFVVAAIDALLAATEATP